VFLVSTTDNNKVLAFNWLLYSTKLLYGLISCIQFDNRNNQYFIHLKTNKEIIAVLFFFKNHSKSLFLSLIDFTAVDLLGLSGSSNKNRFQLSYFLLSHYFKLRLIIQCDINDDSILVDSVSNLYKSSPWLEREVWDMFGIFFFNHPDLRRILTDYGFDGFPLRKDFPITGYSEVRYDEIKKCLVYEPLELTQEMRIFDTLSPWSSLL
jgi:NADH:ubiquinone oxidoreductase subunit C